MIRPVAFANSMALRLSVFFTPTKILKALLLIISLFICNFPMKAQVPNWSFEKGYMNAPNSAIYGTQGVADASNISGIRNYAATWKLGDKLYMFGGQGQGDSGSGQMNDLWEYNTTTGLWRWLKGSKIAIAQVGTYGTRGVESAANNPGTRTQAVTWVSNGLLYLFGGSGTASVTGTGYLNDLWRYNPGTNNWTWIKGSNLTYNAGLYGTKGTAGAANAPGSRFSSASWEYQGKLYLFGGVGRINSTTNGYLNDLWSYDTSTGSWTWVTGSNTTYSTGVYGTLGTATATTTPGARYNITSWTSGNKLYLFGGYIYNGSTAYYGNDLWEFDTTTRLWRWLKGSNFSSFTNGTYGTRGTAASANTPGSRLDSRGIERDGKLYLFGGNGYVGGSAGSLNDLWEYNISTNNWTWIKGSSLINQLSTYGTMGTADAANTPGGRRFGGMWEVNGKIYYFGGAGYAVATSTNLNDFWEYDLANGNWRWMKGSNRPFSVGIYGTKGLAAAANMPGPRNGHTSWAIGTKVYLFGGTGYANGVATGTGNMNDLWEYDTETKLWRWLKGGDIHNQPAVYGTLGVDATANTPGSRTEGTGWVYDNKLYFFGGTGFNASTSGLQNDLWEFDPATQNWKWIKGTNTASQPGVYGTQGTAAATNRPGGRQNITSWVSGSKAYIFGGSGFGSSSSGSLGDLWEYDMISGNWTWLEGLTTPNAVGIYGSKGVAAPANRPGGRTNSASWAVDNKLYLQGGGRFLSL